MSPVALELFNFYGNSYYRDESLGLRGECNQITCWSGLAAGLPQQRGAPGVAGRRHTVPRSASAKGSLDKVQRRSVQRERKPEMRGLKLGG